MNIIKNILKQIYSKKQKEGCITTRILGLKFQKPIPISPQYVMELKQKIDVLQDQMNNLFYELKDPKTLKAVHLPKIKSKEETLNELINSEKSICRFGDGEILTMFFESGSRFQPYTPALSKRLSQVFQSKEDNIMIAINDCFGSLENISEDTKAFWRHFLSRARDKIYQHMDMNKWYYDSRISRPYRSEKNQENIADYFKKFKKLWNNKDVIIVEGEKTRMGVGNDLLDNCQSIQRILCPAENAFDQYDKILSECLKHSKNKLFIIALGATATVLAYDLAMAGHRAVDIGHLDIEYEWMKRRSQNVKIKIPGKYVNEVLGGNNVSDCLDESYLKSIIANIKGQ